MGLVAFETQGKSTFTLIPVVLCMSQALLLDEPIGMRVRAAQFSASPVPPCPGAALGAPSSHFNHCCPHQGLRRRPFCCHSHSSDLCSQFQPPSASLHVSGHGRLLLAPVAQQPAPMPPSTRNPSVPTGRPHVLPQVTAPQAPPLRLLLHKGPFVRAAGEPRTFHGRTGTEPPSRRARPPSSHPLPPASMFRPLPARRPHPPKMARAAFLRLGLGASPYGRAGREQSAVPTATNRARGS